MGREARRNRSAEKAAAHGHRKPKRRRIWIWSEEWMCREIGLTAPTLVSAGTHLPLDNRRRQIAHSDRAW